MKNNSLDQFYTNPKIIYDLIKEVDFLIKSSGFTLKPNWIEPSAGSGNFLHALKKTYTNPKIKAYDIEPHFNDKIIKADFLKMTPIYNKDNLIIGNPPFGKRSQLAIDFINKSFEWADFIAFILPNQFKKYLTQKQINQKGKLIFEKSIQNDAFLVNDRPYDVNCVFQIWVSHERDEFAYWKNKRITKSLKIEHKDFETYIYNNTIETRKYFDKEKYGWHFAIHRQGYYDYNLLIDNPEELKKNVQYFFIKIKNECVYNILRNMDLNELSKVNTTIPGFSKTDFIKFYEKNKRRILRTQKIKII